MSYKNVLDFICLFFTELLSTGYKRTIQNDNVCLWRESNQRPLAFQRFPLTTRLSGLLTTDMWITFTYLFTLRDYKNSVWCAKGYIENKKKIAYLQFRDWYHLNTRWFTQKKRFIMSYMSMTIYNIYSFLFIIVYIVCIIIFFPYIISLHWLKQSRTTGFKSRIRPPYP